MGYHVHGEKQSAGLITRMKIDPKESSREKVSIKKSARIRFVIISTIPYTFRCRYRHHMTCLRVMPDRRALRSTCSMLSYREGLQPHFRSFDNLYLSSIGMGTYLGQPTEEDDRAIENAVYNSVKSGAVNVIDTAINYRAMKSEKSIGRALLRASKRQGDYTGSSVHIYKEWLHHK